MSNPSSRGVYFISLGCFKNLYDTEDISGFLLEAGFAPVGNPAQADIIFINTCSFLGEARREGEDTINEMLSTCPGVPVIVGGCMVKQQQDLILKACPGVAALVDFEHYQDIGRIAAEVLAGKQAVHLGEGFAIPWWHKKRLRMTPGSYAYLKISEGCGRSCTFCTIPQIRGPYHSQSREDLAARARSLVDHGVRELILISQDSARYGRDFDDGTGLGALLEDLQALPDLEWLRVLYLYPGREFTDRLLDTMAALPKVCNYFDIPLQHVSASVLKRMGRQGGAAEYRDLVQRIRETVPGSAIRTTFISGFPGETEADFEQLLGFVQEMRLDHVGCFAYSDEEQAASFGLAGKIEAAVGQTRRDTIMQVQQAIAAEYNQGMVGKTLTVAVDGADGAGGLVGHTRLQAPDVDGAVLIQGPAQAGSFVEVEVTGFSNYDLIGRVT